MKSYSDIAARARELHELGASPKRQWTLPVICDHLAKAMTGSTGVLGSGPARKPTPLILRVVGRVLVMHLGFIPKGRPSPQRVLPQPDVSWDDAIQRLDAAIALCEKKAQTAEPWLFHPLIGFSDRSSWQRFHIVHAKHHFGCLRMRKSQEIWE